MAPFKNVGLPVAKARAQAKANVELEKFKTTPKMLNLAHDSAMGRISTRSALRKLGIHCD